MKTFCVGHFGYHEDNEDCYPKEFIESESPDNIYKDQDLDPEKTDITEINPNELLKKIQELVNQKNIKPFVQSVFDILNA